MQKQVIALAISILAGKAVVAQDAWTLDASRKTASVSPNMWGVFFEDINLGADGGIYAELVKNRSFEFREPFMGWEISGKQWKEGDIRVINDAQQRPRNPRFIRVQARDLQPGGLQLTNEGFRGMGIKAGMDYDFSFWYRQQQPGVQLQLRLLNAAGREIGAASITPTDSRNEWQQASVHFRASDSAQRGRLQIGIVGKGNIDLDQLSLFPRDTWKGRKGGLRGDMVQALADLKPGFIRFPGGCIVEGHELATRYQWKNTVGPVADRPLIINRWNNEFDHRPAPDYYQTFGLGFFEYFQMAEDIGAEPLPILSCGMACQFNTSELVPMEELDPYIQDALDLVEFANGDVTTKWGALRASMGHPAPFGLKMMGVGNENWGPQYLERALAFQKVLKAKHPEIKLVNSVGPYSGGDWFKFLDSSLRAMPADLLDEHYYARPEWFLKNAGRYDNYDRQGSKIFAGEYAAHVDGLEGAVRNNWRSALAEAAFMTGLERNADVVQMASYAPLFAHVDGWQWAPDLIWVDNLQTYYTPNYYVQQLYSLNKGSAVVPLLEAGKAISGKDSLYASAVLDEKAGLLIVKMVNASAQSVQKRIDIKGLKKMGGSAEKILLQGASLDARNPPGEQPQVKPVSSKMTIGKKQLDLQLAPYSFTLLKIPYSK